MVSSLVDGKKQPCLCSTSKHLFCLHICQGREEEQTVVTLHPTLFHLFCVGHALHELHHQGHTRDCECVANDQHTNHFLLITSCAGITGQIPMM